MMHSQRLCKRNTPKGSFNGVRARETRLVADLVAGIPIEESAIGLGPYVHERDQRNGDVEIKHYFPGVAGQNASLHIHAHYVHTFQKITIRGTTYDVDLARTFLATYRSV